MGKQSARLYFEGKDHKDIFFHGKCHDAMYIGAELVWHKIRKEGYYVLIYFRGESYVNQKLIVSIFDEKTQIVEKVLEVGKDQYGDEDIYYIDLQSAMDDERIYLSTIGTSTRIASSMDGIYYGEANLDYYGNEDLFTYAQNYFSYTKNKESGSAQRGNCIYGITTFGIATFYISKSTIKEENGVCTVNTEKVDTKISNRNVQFSDYKESNHLIFSNYGKSKIILHTKQVAQDYGTEKGKSMLTVNYYDVETEISGNITQFNYSAMESAVITDFNYINGVYMFFYRRDINGEKWGEYIHYLYIYYSCDGINYEHSLIERKYTKPGENIAIPRHVLNRMGMYYIYCLPENTKIGSPNVLLLTTDFKHFSKKYIPAELDVDGKTFDTVNGFTPIEADAGARSGRYFYNGEISYPDDGIFASTKVGKVYIDNMFFRKSKGNKIVTLP